MPLSFTYAFSAWDTRDWLMGPDGRDLCLATGESVNLTFELSDAASENAVLVVLGFYEASKVE